MRIPRFPLGAASLSIVLHMRPLHRIAVLLLMTKTALLRRLAVSAFDQPRENASKTLKRPPEELMFLFWPDGAPLAKGGMQDLIPNVIPHW